MQGKDIRTSDDLWRRSRSSPVRPINESDASGARAQVREKYVIHSSRRQVAVTTAWSAGEALIEYLRSRGFRDDELVRMRFDAVSWHGAIFTATKLGDAANAA
jgi:hypothetical protein